MKLCVVGTGYVGLVSGACFAETGNDVICADIDASKVERLVRGEIPIFEPGLGEMVARNQAEKRLSFSSDVAAAIGQSEAVMIAVGTPPRSDGAADLQAVDRVAETVAACVERETVLVLKSTVPVGTNARVRRIVKDAKHGIHVVSNPEFLKEGNAIDDFMRPDRVVIGCDSDDDFALDLMRRLYHPVTLSSDRFICMDPASAELTKYVANTMLAMRISFMNEIAALCEKVGADIHLVRKGVGSDERIGTKFLYAGPGYGGSCLEGKETVLMRRNGRIRLSSLKTLFGELALERGLVTPDAAGILCDDLEVLAWRAGEQGARFFPCSAVTRRRYEGLVVKLRTTEGRRVICTVDHPLVVIDPATRATKVKLAGDVTGDDWLPVATTHATQASNPACLDLLELLPATGIPEQEIFTRLGARTFRLDEAKRLGLELEDARFGTTPSGSSLPRRIALDEPFWRIAGLYLAAGHRSVDGRKERLTWTFAPSAAASLVDEVARYWRLLGVRCDVRRGTSASTVTASSRLLAKLMVEVLRLGGSCYEHRLPDLAWSASRAEQQALLSGLWHGDGSWCYVGGGRGVALEHATVSRELADGVVRMLAAHDVVARVKRVRTTESTRATFRLTIAGAAQVERALALVPPHDQGAVAFAIAWHEERRRGGDSCRVSGGIAAVRIHGKELGPFVGDVYSLEVESAGTVVTTGGLVIHNCFPKDVVALVHTARDQGVELELASATDRVNSRQKSVLARKLKQVHFDGDLRGKRVGVWGLAFKPRTDDVRESPALPLIEALLSEGAEVRAHDPEAMDKVREIYAGGIVLVDDAYDAAADADALVLVTEWRQYQNPDFARLRGLMRRPLLLDGRNIWAGYGLRKLGFEYDGIGVRGS